MKGILVRLTPQVFLMSGAGRPPSCATRQALYQTESLVHPCREKLNQELVSAVVKIAADVLRLISCLALPAHCTPSNGGSMGRES